MTVDYFNQQFNQALDCLSQLRQTVATVDKWGMKNPSDHFERSAKLFLYINTIANYDPTAVFNFLTEQQVYFIIEQLRTLSGISNNDTISEKVYQFT